ncbi:protein of unknown function [Methylorubrum extorquens DM4]|uniref:GIY-YIG domain-containing protein n=1 Tax=Methylorubrum extorquens (strain DSM 6343 / CIP 106787 / DM4) TaxID=661410 RepID=C7CIJ3_METED|nr:protein of unknown function [Methylorubrum extorquens DM4]
MRGNGLARGTIDAGTYRRHHGQCRDGTLYMGDSSNLRRHASAHRNRLMEDFTTGDSASFCSGTNYTRR